MNTKKLLTLVTFISISLSHTLCANKLIEAIKQKKEGFDTVKKLLDDEHPSPTIIQDIVPAFHYVIQEKLLGIVVYFM